MYSTYPNICYVSNYQSVRSMQSMSKCSYISNLPPASFCLLPSLSTIILSATFLHISPLLLPIPIFRSLRFLLNGCLLPNIPTPTPPPPPLLPRPPDRTEHKIQPHQPHTQTPTGRPPSN